MWFQHQGGRSRGGGQGGRAPLHFLSMGGPAPPLFCIARYIQELVTVNGVFNTKLLFFFFMLPPDKNGC